MAKKFIIGDQRIEPGERRKVFLKVAALYDYTDLHIPIEVIRGDEDGPVLFISAAIHGDEINGVEIVRRVLKRLVHHPIKGTLIAVPIVNVFGFNNQSRYLPDRRDLNRSFPGSRNGSLTARLAWIFSKEIVSKSTHGIDLHTGGVHRTNLPQIRACLDDPATAKLAKAFGVPVILHSSLRDGSLREAARKKGIPMLLFEGGEALRFNESAIRLGVRGCMQVMRNIGMLPKLKKSALVPQKRVFVANDSHWIRAPHSGTLVSPKALGGKVLAGDLLGVISDPFGQEEYEVRAETDGIVVGVTTNPLVNLGDAMFHVATFNNTRSVVRALDQIHGPL